jgi:DNA-binding IclR family transcriptional regulator
MPRFAIYSTVFHPLNEPLLRQSAMPHGSPYAAPAVVAALSISGPSQRLPHRALSGMVEAARAAAGEISHCLGYPAGSPTGGGEA